MRLTLLLAAMCLMNGMLTAANISGIVTDQNGAALSYASVLVKGTGIGTTANDAGRYSLELDQGQYILVCQYVGYVRQEIPVTVRDGNQVVSFRLSLQQTNMKEVIITPGGEDPAYEIIRNAIKKRSYYLNQVKNFQCEVYIKGQLKLRDYPKKFFGQKVEFEDTDTSKLKMLYLAESISTYSVQNPGKVKIEVTSTRVSGQSDGFGLSQPQIISFYENNIQIGNNLNPRGFVSPIAANALEYYKYVFEGVFIEDGKEINKIRVVPKAKFEPVFSGHIFITENDWRIHSIRLKLTKESQMDIVDTLQIEQLYVPLENNVWVIKSQVIYPAVKFFGFDAFGSFVNVYRRFNLNPVFDKGFFDNTFLKFTDSSNKRTLSHWDTVRPVPLEVEEKADYKKKDSLELVRRSPHYLDSIDRRRNKPSVTGLMFTGQAFSRERKRATYSVMSLLDAVNYNTFEGVVVNWQFTYTKRLDSTRTRRSNIFVTPNFRYGFSNRHFNSALTAGYVYGRKYRSSFTISGGKDVLQFNPGSPITPKNNTINTLLFGRNFMKTYEAWFTRIKFDKGVGEGLTLRVGVEFEDRMPLNNTDLFSFKDENKRRFTPNYPVELVAENIRRHQAFSGSAGLSWQPGARYIEFPDSKINIGSKYPTFDFMYTKGFTDDFGSDVNYDKWRLVARDDINFKLAGSINYRVSIGGFLNNKKAALPDYQHFNGNQSIFAGAYLNSFQVAPYYQNSTIARFYTTLNVEHHFNGLLTNKLPLFKRLNWHLVTGSNAFYVNTSNNYVEVFAGIENIFRIFRVDFVQSFSSGRKPYSGIVFGVQGALFGR